MIFSSSCLPAAADAQFVECTSEQSHFIDGQPVFGLGLQEGENLHRGHPVSFLFIFGGMEVECIFCLNENAYFDGVNYVCPDCGREWPCDEIADDDDDNNKLRCPECGSHLVYPDSSGINEYACDACGCRWDGDDDDYDEDYDDDNDED